MTLSTADITLPPLLDFDSLARIESEFEAALANAGVRVVLLRGANGVFCRGMHLEAMLEAAAPERGVEHYGRLLQRMRHAPKPVIAAVDGEAAAGGIGFIAVADLALATETSTFALPEVLFGLLPAIVLAALRERIAPQKARLWTLAARNLHGKEALAVGLLDELLASGPDLERAVRGWSRRLARAAPPAVAALKARGEPFDFAAAVAHTSGTVGDPVVRSAILRFFKDGEVPWQ